MSRKIRYRRKPCPHCRDLITTNALGRAAHIRFCDGTPKPDLKPLSPGDLLKIVRGESVR